MILTREIEVKITESNFQYFENLGYDVVIGEVMDIPVELLSKGSNKKILCECDKCGTRKEVIFKNYMKYDNAWGFYTCRKCLEDKRKESLLKSYGVEYPLRSKVIENRMKKTMMDRYGVDNIKKKKNIS